MDNMIFILNVGVIILVFGAGLAFWALAIMIFKEIFFD